MKNTKQKDLALTIPHEIMLTTEISTCTSIDLDISNETIVVTKTEMTAKDILKTISTLNEKSSELTLRLANACGKCDDCFDCFDFNEFDDTLFEIIPSEVLNAYIDAEICIYTLFDLIKSDETITEGVNYGD